MYIYVYNEKDRWNKQVYYDPAGYGSMKNTLEDAKEIDPSIKLDDVK